MAGFSIPSFVLIGSSNYARNDFRSGVDGAEDIDTFLWELSHTDESSLPKLIVCALCGVVLATLLACAPALLTSLTLEVKMYMRVKSYLLLLRQPPSASFSAHYRARVHMYRLFEAIPSAIFITILTSTFRFHPDDDMKITLKHYLLLVLPSLLSLVLGFAVLMTDAGGQVWRLPAILVRHLGYSRLVDEGLRWKRDASVHDEARYNVEEVRDGDR